jgi:hypothetical protein
MSDGSVHITPTEVESTARQVVDLYFRNVNTTASPYDLWQVGDALLGYIGEVSSESESSLAVFELETDARFRAIERRVVELEQVVAKMIFDLNEIGIDFNFKEIYDFRKQYLKK